MPSFSKPRWIIASIIGIITVFTIVMGIFCSTHEPEDMRSFLALRYKWDRTAVGQGKEEFAYQCLELAKKYPDSTGGLSALYLAACRAPKTKPGQETRELFITQIAKADLGHLDKAIEYTHHCPSWNVWHTPPDNRYYFVSRDDEVVLALLDRLKRSDNDPHTAGLLTCVCTMSKGGDNAEPTKQFTEAADLIASQHAASPDIANFCESLGFLSGSPSWAGRYEHHLRTILKTNRVRRVQCAAQFALASIVESYGESRQTEAEILYRQFLEKYDGKQQYHYQGIEQALRKQAKKQIEALRLCGIGKPATEIAGVDLNGRQMKLSEYRGKDETALATGHGATFSSSRRMWLIMSSIMLAIFAAVLLFRRHFAAIKMRP